MLIQHKHTLAVGTTVRRSGGAFEVLADVRGSYGEIVHTQVGRNFANLDTAIDWAQRTAERFGWTGVVVRNRSTCFQFTVVV